MDVSVRSPSPQGEGEVLSCSWKTQYFELIPALGSVRFFRIKGLNLFNFPVFLHGGGEIKNVALQAEADVVA